MDIGTNVKKRRHEQGLTLERLAERCEVSRAMLSDIERGRKNPTIKIVCQIAAALQCSVSQLLEEEELLSQNKQQIYQKEEPQTLVDPRTGAVRQLLAPTLVKRGLEIIMYEIPAGQKIGPFPAHQPGVAEHLTVIEGTLLCQLAGQEIQITERESLTFRADQEHAFTCVSPKVCRYFLVIDNHLDK